MGNLPAAQERVLFRAAVCVSHHFVRAVFAQPAEVDFGKEDARFFRRLEDAHIARAGFVPEPGNAVKDRRAAVAVGLPGGIVAGGDGGHVLVRAGAERGKPVDFHRAGVRSKDNFRALEHQNPRAFREFPVKAYHRADVHRAAGSVEGSHVKSVAGKQVPLGIERAGVDFRVAELQNAVPVKKRKRVARKPVRFFKERDADCHAKLRRKRLERARKSAVSRNRLRRPLFRWPPGDAVAVAPHLREQRDVRPERLRRAAGLNARAQVLFQRAARQNLKQRDFQNGHVFVSSECSA